MERVSSYTIRLQRLLQSNFEIWDKQRPFPIFNESHREELQKMIEDHYYMQEIGFETPMLFKHFLNTRMREIMPKYNAMYASVGTYDENNFFTYKESGQSSGTTSNGSVNTHNEGSTSKNFIESRQYNYDTPMNMDSEDLGGNHMSSATINKANGDNNRNETNSNGGYTTNDSGQHSDSYSKTVNGQSPYKTIEEYRALIFNIDEMIINELGDLFMMIF